jgi:O-antigen ligase
VGAYPLRRLDGGSYFLILALTFFALLAAFGGASRADELQQAVVRFAAIAVLIAALWPLNLDAFRDARGPMIGVMLIYLVLLAQLIPLPAHLWGRMPGHDIYTPIAQATGSAGWRPWTLSPDLTLNALGALLPATVMGLLTLALDFRGRLLLAQWVIGMASVSALLGLLQLAGGGTFLHLFRTSSENSAVGLFANRNHQAGLMACALPILAAVTSIRMRESGRTARAHGIAAGIATLLLMGLAATGSRMGLLLGLVSLTAGAMILAVTTQPRFSRKWLSAFAVAFIAAIPVAVLVTRSGSIVRLASEPVDRSRMAAIPPMLEAARAYMPFGAGFGTFDPVYRHFEPDSTLSTIYLNQAHNEPVQLAIEGGIPALLLLLLFLGWWTRAAIRTTRRRESVSRRALGMAMVATALILMLSSLVDYPLRTPLLSGLFAIACVELVRSKRRSVTEAAKPS